MVLNRLKLSSTGLPLLSSPEMGVEMSLGECACLERFLTRMYMMTMQPVSDAVEVIKGLSKNLLSRGTCGSPVMMSDPLMYKWAISTNGLYCLVDIGYSEGYANVYKFQVYREGFEGRIDGCGFPIFTHSVR